MMGTLKHLLYSLYHLLCSYLGSLSLKEIQPSLNEQGTVVRSFKMKQIFEIHNSLFAALGKRVLLLVLLCTVF